MGMVSLDQFVDYRLLHDRAHFDREETLAAVDLNPEGLTAEITRLVKKRRLANPRHGFYLILRTEGPMAGAQIQFADRPLRNTRESMHVLQQLRIKNFRSI